MVLSHSSMVSSSHKMVRSVRCVAISPAVRSSNSNTFWINCFSSWSMVPFWVPTSTIMRISSSLTVSSSALGSMPSRRSTALVEMVKNHTMGAKSVAMLEMRPEIPSARASALRMATRLGTSSPKIRVK